jgi:hypothetical protein
MARTLVRTTGPHLVAQAGLTISESAESEELLEVMVERVTSPAPPDGLLLTGEEWLHLAIGLGRFDSVFLGTTAWTRLSEQLIAELARTRGVDQLCRFEACATLMAHPTSRCCARWAAG